MKSINNKTIQLLGKDATYAELLKACNDVTLEKGWTKADMKASLKVDTALEAAKETIELEDADFEYLKPKVSNMPWAVKDKALVEFTEYIESI